MALVLRDGFVTEEQFEWYFTIFLDCICNSDCILFGMV